MAYARLPRHGCLAAVALLASIACPDPVACAGPVATPVALSAILDDQELIEDFDGVSVHGGTTLPAPNPLSSLTAPPSWGILPGITYTSTASLRLYGGFNHGDDSVMLQSPQAASVLSVDFNQAQRAAGLELVNSTGNVTLPVTVTFYRQCSVLGTISFNIPPATTFFAGWEDAQGITSITTDNGWVNIDNVQWGIDLPAPPPITIPQQPEDAATCRGHNAPFSVVAAGAAPLSYQWQIQDPASPGLWFSLGNDPGPLPPPGGGAAYAFPIDSPDVSVGVLGRVGVFHVRCIVSNACGSATTDPAALTICAADFNCNGVVNSADFFDYLRAFFDADPAADINADGNVTSQDFFDYLGAFFSGC